MRDVQPIEGQDRHKAGRLLRCIQRLGERKVMGRLLFAFACFATLIALVYAVENWRGKRAWESTRRELEAQGDVLDWNAFIPAPVPDDQNIFKAPKMQEWFVKGALAESLRPSRGAESTNAAPAFVVARSSAVKRAPVLLAEVEVDPPESSRLMAGAAAVLRFGEPSAREEAAKLIRGLVGPCAKDVWGEVTLARPVDQIKPIHLVLQAEKVLSASELAAFFPRSSVPDDGLKATGHNNIRITPAGTNAFRLFLQPPESTAMDYLARSQSAVPDLDLLRKALERPSGRMDGNYERPFERPIPDFVRLRTVAQLLAQRALCYLLLGQPEEAWHELALVHDMCRLLSGAGRRSTMLVEAMIQVAITGLYLNIVEEGMRLQAWQEPQLVAIQNQLQEVNLLQVFSEAMNAERTVSIRTLETTTPAELAKLYFLGGEFQGVWSKLKNPLFLQIRFAPCGWLYQNMRAGTLLKRFALQSLDMSQNRVSPRVADSLTNQVRTISEFAPYTLLSRSMMPNYSKALKTTTRNQTIANEAYIACGLERYRLVKGQYPETLEALVPQFAEKLPHDLIGGGPLKYRRTDGGGFVLYSIGWNEKDDGGSTSPDSTEGDWVWPGSSR
jgi:hypothetical protein